MGEYMGTLSLEPSNIMHLKVLTFFAIICSSALADQFGKYQTEFGKQYTSPKEYVQRKAIFEANLKEIEKHNENRANTYTMGVNQFTDMTQNEFDALIQGLPKMPKEVQKNNVDLAQLLQSPELLNLVMLLKLDKSLMTWLNNFWLTVPMATLTKMGLELKAAAEPGPKPTYITSNM